MPLHILCARPGCEGALRVRTPSEQRRHRFCSRRCAALVTQNIRRAQPGKGGRTSGRRRQQASLARVAGLTPLQAFRLGYVRGLQSKLRQIRTRYVLTPRCA